MIFRLIDNIKPVANLLAILAFSSCAAFGDDFARILSPQDAHEAGLTKLTPEELAKLEALVQHYKAPELAAGPGVRASQPTSTPMKSSGFLPPWVGAIITLQQIAKAPADTQGMEASLTGDFSGRGGRTNFRLDNGQLWTQANNEAYKYSPTLHTPKVKIYPTSFGSFWMEAEGVHQRCRVKQVKLD